MERDKSDDSSEGGFGLGCVRDFTNLFGNPSPESTPQSLSGGLGTSGLRFGHVTLSSPHSDIQQAQMMQMMQQILTTQLEVIKRLDSFSSDLEKVQEDMANLTIKEEIKEELGSHVKRENIIKKESDIDVAHTDGKITRADFFKDLNSKLTTASRDRAQRMTEGELNTLKRGGLNAGKTIEYPKDDRSHEVLACMWVLLITIDKEREALILAAEVTQKLVYDKYSSIEGLSASMAERTVRRAITETLVPAGYIRKGAGISLPEEKLSDIQCLLINKYKSELARPPEAKEEREDEKMTVIAISSGATS